MSSVQRILRPQPFFLFGLFFVLFSCRKSDTSHPDSLSISKTAIRIDTAIATVDSFNVQSTVRWTALLSPNADWLRLDKVSGAQGNTTIKLTIVSNDPTVMTQVATITITATGRNDIPPVTVTVTKKSFTFSLGFHKELGGTNDEEALRSMAKTLDGGIILTSATSSNDGDVHRHHGDRDLWVVRLNASGDTVWTKTYGGSAEDGGASVIALPDGGYMVCGTTSSADGDIHRLRGGTDAWLLRLNANGDTLWTKTYGGTGNDRANSIIATAGDGFAVSGLTESHDGDIHTNHGSGDVWLLKLDVNGDILWTKTFGGSSWDEATGIIATPDGGYALSAMTNSNDQDVAGFHVSAFFTFDMWIVRLDATGNKLWAKALGGTLNDVALSIVAGAGGFVITGHTSSNDGDVTGYHGRNPFFNDMWVVKLNDNGAIVWAKTYGGSFDDEGISVIATPDGGYAIAGATNSKDGDVTGYHDGQGTDDIWVVKLNANGARQWTKTIGGINDDVGGSIIPVPDGFIISGFTNSNNGDFSGSGYHGNYDICVVKLLVQ